MRPFKSSSLVIGSLFLSLLIAGATVVTAQIDEGNPKRLLPRVKIQKVVRVVKVPEIRFQKVAGVAITTVQPNADIKFEPEGGRKGYRQVKKTDGDGVLNLENVPPGKYNLTVSLDGYVTEESDVDVIAQRLVTVPVNLAPITHEILIKTNVKTGEVRYAHLQKRPGGGRSSQGGYCMVPIQNGNAVITMLEGAYNIEVHPADVEYKMVSREITVSDEALSKSENAAGQNEIPINLTRMTSTEDFLANWLPNEWRLPAGWKIENKRMQANGPGVALLQNERYNYYKDFELRTNVRSLDNKSVGFVVRAVDDQNYYLIQITGSAAAEPYFLTGYIVKNGKVAEVLVPSNIKAYAQSFSDKKYFNLTITAKGNIFRVKLEDVETGQSFVIGIVEDQNNTFPIGAVGVGSKDASRFDVNLFNINYK